VGACIPYVSLELPHPTCKLSSVQPQPLMAIRPCADHCSYNNITGEGFSYSLLSVRPGADPGVQTVSPQVTISHPPGGRLPLLSARPAVTFPAAQQHRPLAGTKLYCLVTEAHGCQQLTQGCYAALPQVGFEPTTCWSQVQRSTRCTTSPPLVATILMSKSLRLTIKLSVTESFSYNSHCLYTKITLL